MGNKKRGNPNWKKGQPSPNPAGAPKRGESWGEIIKKIGNMTGEEVAQYAETFREIAKDLGKLGKMTLKESAVLRAYHAFLQEPNASLWNVLLDRDEGKVPDVLEATVTMGWREDAKQKGYDPDYFYEQAERIRRERSALPVPGGAGEAAERSGG